MSSLSLKNLNKIYDNNVQAVFDFNLEVEDGDFVVLVGPSGCGKSTTLRMIAGLEDITSGQLIIDGKDVTKMPPKDRDIAMVFQNYALYGHMTIYQNMAFSLVLRKENSDLIHKKVMAAAEILGLTEQLNKKPKQLSGGQRQRISNARALVLKPKFLVLDEPVSALDVSIQAQILNLLKNLQEKYDLTYLFISHDLNVVRHVSDRIAVMYLGNIVEVATKEQLFSNPKHPYSRALISAIPKSHPNDTVERILLKGEIPDPSNPPQGCPFHTRCPFTEEGCKKERIGMTKLSEEHEVACILYENN